MSTKIKFSPVGLPRGTDKFSELVRYYGTSGLDRDYVCDKPLPLYIAKQRATDEYRKTIAREYSVDARVKPNELDNKEFEHCPYMENARSVAFDPFEYDHAPGEEYSIELLLDFQSVVSQLLKSFGRDTTFKKILYAMIRHSNTEHYLSIEQQKESQFFLKEFSMRGKWHWSQLASICGYSTSHGGGTASGGFYAKRDAFKVLSSSVMKKIMETKEHHARRN